MKFFFSFLLLVAVFAVSSQEKLAGQPDLPGDLLLDFGLNYWDQEGDTIKGWPSRSLGIYYNKRFRISNKFSFYAALGLGFEQFAFKGNYVLTRVDGNIVLDTIMADIKKNKLGITYLDVPLEFRFHPKGTIEGEGLFLGVGVIPGLKIGAHTKVKYKIKGAIQKQKLRANFGLNDYRFGLQLRVGWRGVHFFYKTYLTKVFRHKQDIVDPTFTVTGDQFNPAVTTFGVNFSGF